MLFNSYEFIFGFLPATLIGFFILGRLSRGLALGWLTLASLFFYAWWRPINVPIIAVSLTVNFLIARTLLRLGAEQTRPRLATGLLFLGIAFNIVFLGYFKYTNFIQTAISDMTGTQFVAAEIILPLGISFITFQKIAFLIDVHARRIESISLPEYCLFVLFFPQLIAGPIVHYREMMPQFQRNPCRFDGSGVAVGLTLLCFGLFKKVVLADGIAEHVTPVFDTAAGGQAVSLFPAWLAALGFTLQIYFDFSGYSDMAAGLARCFGIRLPINFDSPLKAKSIIEFWSRWHITLTRFLTAYLYNPLVLWLTRRRLAKGLPGLSARTLTIGAFVKLLALPTLFTMFVSGVWHGAGYVFILWGVLHGIYLIINHAWRFFGAKFWPNAYKRLQLMPVVGFALTFIAVVAAMVIFRAPSVESAVSILKGMVAMNGIELPRVIYERIAGLPLHDIFAATDWAAKDFVIAYAWVGSLLFIALVFPNSLQILSKFEPVLGQPQPLAQSRLERLIEWRPSLAWAAAISIIAAVSIMRVGGKSEFLYWQF